MKKLGGVLIFILVALLAIMVLKGAIIEDQSLQDSFVAIFIDLPFAKAISEIVCKVCRYTSNPFEAITKVGVIYELNKLLMIGILAGTVFRVLMKLLLPLPSNREAAERYMDSFGYKAKEALLTVVSFPVVTFVSCELLEWLKDLIAPHAGNVGSFFVGLLIFIVLLVLSALLLSLGGGIGFGKALGYRLGTGVLEKLLEIFGTDVFCMVIALSVVNQKSNAVLLGIFALVLYLFGIDLLLSAVSGRLTRLY